MHRIIQHFTLRNKHEYINIFNTIEFLVEIKSNQFNSINREKERVYIILSIDVLHLNQSDWYVVLGTLGTLDFQMIYLKNSIKLFNLPCAHFSHNINLWMVMLYAHVLIRLLYSVFIVLSNIFKCKKAKQMKKMKTNYGTAHTDRLSINVLIQPSKYCYWLLSPYP